MRSESGDENCPRFFENLVEECIQEVSTMEYFRGNSHIVSVEDYKVMEYLTRSDGIFLSAWKHLTSFMEYGKISQKRSDEVSIDLCRSLEYCGQLHIIHRDIKPRIFLYPGSGLGCGLLESPENWKKP